WIGPCSARNSRMALACSGPIPGSSSSSRGFARLTLTLCGIGPPIVAPCKTAALRSRYSVAEATGYQRLRAEAEPAVGVAAESTAQAERHEDDGDDHDEPVDEGLPDVQAGQQLRQDDQEPCAQHRAEQRGQPSQDDDRDELDGQEEAELLGIEE